MLDVPSIPPILYVTCHIILLSSFLRSGLRIVELNVASSSNNNRTVLRTELKLDPRNPSLLQPLDQPVLFLLQPYLEIHPTNPRPLFTNLHHFPAPRLSQHPSQDQQPSLATTRKYIPHVRMSWCLILKILLLLNRFNKTSSESGNQVSYSTIWSPVAPVSDLMGGNSCMQRSAYHHHQMTGSAPPASSGCYGPQSAYGAPSAYHYSNMDYLPPPMPPHHSQLGHSTSMPPHMTTGPNRTESHLTSFGYWYFQFLC